MNDIQGICVTTHKHTTLRRWKIRECAGNVKIGGISDCKTIYLQNRESGNVKKTRFKNGIYRYVDICQHGT
jgi:hypothetical protein